jgi:hypothetical protein
LTGQVRDGIQVCENAVYRPSGLFSSGRDSGRAHNVGDARREIQSHQLAICRPVTEQFLAFLPEETAGHGDVVITLPKDDPAGYETGPPLAVFRTMLAAISGNVFLPIEFSSDLKQSQVLSGPNGVLMKTNLRYQNGSLYEHHGAWFVRYSRRISEQDGSTNLNRVSKYLGRSKDFRSISDVERSRASFMQTVNRDRLSANSRITLTAFVEGAYLPWTKEERRASTSKGHHEIWINHIRDHVGELHLREFRTVDASRMLRTIAKENDLTKTTLQHIK